MYSFNNRKYSGINIRPSNYFSNSLSYTAYKNTNHSKINNFISYLNHTKLHCFTFLFEMYLYNIHKNYSCILRLHYTIFKALIYTILIIHTILINIETFATSVTALNSQLPSIYIFVWNLKYILNYFQYGMLLNHTNRF